MRPQAVLRQVDPRGGEVVPLIPEIIGTIEAREERHWDRVLTAMVDVVHGPRGTARRVGVGADYRMAGKTGTAQLFGVGQDEKYEVDKVDTRLRDHGLFIAFAPAERPRIAVAILVENAGSGSRSAAPIARRVFDHYLRGDPESSEDDALITAAN